jgi:hypothetical protein
MPFFTGQIGGNVGVAGATVNLTGTTTASQTSAADGSYLFTGLPAGSYTVTPTLSGTNFSPTSQSVSITTGQHLLNVNFGTAWSQPDCRQAVAGFGPGPNAFRAENGTDIYDVQVSDNPAVPGADSRAAGAPVACGTYPQNSRTAPPFHG